MQRLKKYSLSLLGIGTTSANLRKPERRVAHLKHDRNG